MDSEIVTEKIVTQNKTFLVDLKQNQAGYYLKISEWSNSKKSSVFIPQEGVDQLIQILQKYKTFMSEGESTTDLVL